MIRKEVIQNAGIAGNFTGKLPANAKPGQGIHHINFGIYLKEKMDPLKIECLVRHKDEVANPVPEMIQIFTRHFRLEKP